MARQLTLKQAEFVKEYVANGGNGTHAALAVYDTEDVDTAGVIASENLGNPKIATAMQAALAALNIGEANIAVVVRDALQATRQTAIGVNQNDQQPIIVETPDHSIRLKSATLAAKLLDAYPMKRTVDGAKRLRQEIDLANVPTEVLEFQVAHGRQPTSRERDELLGVKNPVDKQVATRVKVPAKPASGSKRKR